jgi:hypothetical protein
MEAKEPVNLLYYGDGGTGKTTALAAMANTGRVLVVNAESGVKGRALRARGVDVSNIELFPGPDESVTFDSLEEQWNRVREALNADPEAYVGVLWDSVTEIYKTLLDSVVAKAVVKSERQGKERDRFFIDRADYGVMTEQVRGLVRKYRDLPCHFGVSALTRREQDDDGSVSYQPAVTPALQNDLVGWMGVVCHTSVVLVAGEEEFRGLFRPHGKYRGKDRLQALPKWLVDPTFDRILQYVDEGMDVSEDPVMQAAKDREARAQAQESAPAAVAGRETTNEQKE